MVGIVFARPVGRHQRQNLEIQYDRETGFWGWGDSSPVTDIVHCLKTAAVQEANGGVPWTREGLVGYEWRIVILAQDAEKVRG